jgi:ElaB/YqjD/DUF883 family membrane-anchored ribosome-binding protein
MDTKETVTGNGNVAIHDWEPYNTVGSHKDAGEIEHDIEETRHVMDEILDTLSSRLKPGNFVNRMMNSLRRPETRERTKDIFYDYADRVSSSFQRNPLPLMIIAAGVTWQLWETQQPKEQQSDQMKGDLRSTKAATERNLSETGDHIRSNVSNAKQNIQEKFTSMRENAKDTFKSSQDKFQHRYGEMHANAKERGANWQQESQELQDHASQSLRNNARRNDQLLHDNPLLVGAAAIFAGLFLGSLLPETKAEHRVLGDKPKDVLEKADENVMSKEREVTQTVTQKAEDLASDRNLNREEHKPIGPQPEMSAGKKQPVAAKIQKSQNEIKNDVLKSAEQKIDENKNK